jgi:hypothetical protein
VNCMAVHTARRIAPPDQCLPLPLLPFPIGPLPLPLPLLSFAAGLAAMTAALTGEVVPVAAALADDDALPLPPKLAFMPVELPSLQMVFLRVSRGAFSCWRAWRLREQARGWP